MVTTKRFLAALAMMVGCGCAEPAPELPTGKTIDDVTWTDDGQMVVAGYCMTCCGEDWGPGPEVSCPGDPTGGGFPTGSPGNPAGCGGAMNPCVPYLP